MNSFEEFKEFFKEEVVADLEELEERRKGMFTQRLRLGLIVAGLIFGHLVLIFFNAFTLYSISITLIFVPLIGFLVYRKLYVDEAIPADYKDTVVKRMISFMDDSLDYDADGFIDYEVFEQSKLFPLQPDHYTGDDLISGEIEGVPVQLSELMVQYEKTDKRRKKSKWNTVFNGIFLIAEPPLEFKGRTFILPDKLYKKMGYTGKLIQKYDLRWGKYINPTNPEFASKFVAYSDTVLEGERILTEGFMEKILYLSRKSRAEVFVSCIANKVYIGVNLKREIFKVNLAEPLYKPKFAKSFYDEIYYILSIVEDLKLNELLSENSEVEEETEED